MNKPNIEQIPGLKGELLGFQCSDCGAVAPVSEQIHHHATCKPGSAKEWELYYEQANEDGLGAALDELDCCDLDPGFACDPDPQMGICSVCGTDTWGRPS